MLVGPHSAHSAVAKPSFFIKKTISETWRARVSWDLSKACLHWTPVAFADGTADAWEGDTAAWEGEVSWENGVQSHWNVWNMIYNLH
jgi:hypothetical protein